jgi:hypothetical protein
LSRRPALQSRHLAQRRNPGGHAHHDSPSDQSDPRPVREVVREELRAQAVERVRGSGSHRDQQAGRPPEPGQGVGNERDHGQDGDRDDQGGAAGVVGLAGRSGPGEQRDPRRHRADAQDLTPSDPLAEHSGSDPEQDDEARGQDRFDQRERDQKERSDLRGPAAEREEGTDQPPRPGDQAAKQRDAKVLLLGRLPGLERLQPDGARVQDRGREGERETGDDMHGQGAR